MRKLDNPGVKWLCEQGLTTTAMDLSYSLDAGTTVTPFRVYRSLEKMTPDQYLRRVMDVPNVSLSTEALRTMGTLGQLDTHNQWRIGVVMHGGRIYMLDDVVDMPELFKGMVFDGIAYAERRALRWFVLHSLDDLYGYVYEAVDETGTADHPDKPYMIRAIMSEKVMTSPGGMMCALGIPKVALMAKVRGVVKHV